jgi:flagellar protein FlaJ
MPLNRWQKFTLKLRIRYKIPRRLFTLYIPAIIAILLAILAFTTGFASFASPQASSTQSQQAALREAEIEALGVGGAGKIITNFSAPEPASGPVKQNLYLVFVGVPLIAFLPFVVDTSLQTRREARYEQDFADFLFELSELVRGGIDPAKSFLTLAEGETGSITKFIRMAASQMKVGFTFEQALKNFGNAIGSKLANQYIDLVIQASYAGGSVSNLIQNAAVDMSTFLTIEKEKKSGLSQYAVVLYMGQIVLIALAAILVVQFIPELTQITSIGAAGLSGFLGAADIANVTIERNLFFLVYFNGLFGGLVIGKISEGKIKQGLKHSLILILIALFAWDLYVLPASSSSSISGQQLVVHVVSYDKVGIAGFPMRDPLVINVTNAHGDPVPEAPVSFVITGGGTVTPPQASTDAQGEASVKVTLGSQSGPYVILITAGAGQTTVIINATTL